MAVNISVRNQLDEAAQYSYLSSNIVVGAGTIGVKNINAFSANHAVQIGRTGEEQTEIALIGAAAPSGTAFVLAGTVRFSHAIDTPVYDINFDKVIIKQSTVGTAGTAVALTNGTVSITPDSMETVYPDSTGAGTYAYKTAWYNSATDTSSADSAWFTPAGYQPYQLASIRQRVKNKLFDSGFFNKDDAVDEWINEWAETMNNAAIQVDESYSLGSTNASFGTAGLGTITPEDFKEIKRLWVTYDGSSYMKAGHIDIANFYPNDNFSSTHPYYYNYGDNVFGVKPSDTAGTASIVYYKLGVQMFNDDDELPYAMRSYSKSFVDYCLGEAYYLDNQTDRGDRYSQRAEAAKNEFVKQITPRGKDGISTIIFDMPVNEDEYEYL